MTAEAVVERAPRDYEIDEYVESLTPIDKLKEAMGRGAEWWTDTIRKVPLVGPYITTFWWSADRALAMEAKDIAKQLRAGYAELGFHKTARYDENGQIIRKKAKKPAEVTRVIPRHIRVYFDRVVIKLETGRLIKYTEHYTNPKVLQSLSTRLERPVMNMANPTDDLGIWLSVGKPVTEQRYLSDFLLTETEPRRLKHFPEIERDGFWLPFGVIIGMGEELLWVDVDFYPHISYAGITRYGKSAAATTVILWYCALYDPRYYKLVVCDPKGSSTFNELPHLLFDSVAKDFESFAFQANTLVDIINERFETFAKAGVDNINDYNLYCDAKGKDRMGRILVTIDEFTTEMDLADAGTRKKIGAQVHFLLARGAGAGVHGITIAQDWGADFANTKHKANVALTLSTKVRDTHRARAQTVPGAHLINTKGHFKCFYDGQFYDLMSPYTPTRAKEKKREYLAVPFIVDLIKQKWSAVADETTQINVEAIRQTNERELIEKMLHYAADELRGKFSVNKLHSQRGNDWGLSNQRVRDYAEQLEDWGILFSHPNPTVGRVLVTDDINNPKSPIRWDRINSILDKMFPQTEDTACDAPAVTCDA